MTNRLGFKHQIIFDIAHILKNFPFRLFDVCSIISFSMPSNSITSSVSLATSPSLRCDGSLCCSMCSLAADSLCGLLNQEPLNEFIESIAMQWSSSTCIYGWAIWRSSLDIPYSMGSIHRAHVHRGQYVRPQHIRRANLHSLISTRYNATRMRLSIWRMLCVERRRRLTWKTIWQIHQSILNYPSIANVIRIWHAASMLCRSCRMWWSDLQRHHREWRVRRREMHADAVQAFEPSILWHWPYAYDHCCHRHCRPIVCLFDASSHLCNLL